MTASRLVGSAIILGLLLCGCTKERDEDNDQQNPPTTDEASGTVRTDTNGVITTPEGAQIVIPVGAVPRTEAGGAGTITFSADRVTNPEIVNLPAQYTVVESAYRFGPEGFVFAVPVEISLPVTEDYRIGEIQMGRINPNTHQLEIYSSRFVPDSNRIYAQTYEMSIWVVVRNAIDAEIRAYSWVCIHNNVPNAYANICIESFQPAFPEDANFAGMRSSVSPGNWVDYFLWADNWIRWSIPQGTYSFCVEFVRVDSTADRRSVVLAQIPVTDPDGWLSWDGLLGDCDNFELTDEHYNSATPGTRCECNPRETPSVGTGEVQVTLVWHNPLALDLDLWVTDPAGERCYYGNTPSSSGGVLDRDNLCSSYENGRPENIYWTHAPTGTYRVDVDWYSSCGNTIAEQSYSVRIAGRNESETVDGTIHPNETINVADFEIGGDGGLRLSPRKLAFAVPPTEKQAKTVTTKF